MSMATQSIRRNKAGGLTRGVGGASGFTGAGLVLAGVAGMVLAGAPEDGCFLSFGTFGFSFSDSCQITQFIRPGEKGLILEVKPLRSVHSKLAGEIPLRPGEPLPGRILV